MSRFEHAISTRPEIGRCHRCERLILAGHDDGMAYRVEVDPINQHGEIAAVIDGIDTFQMIGATLAYRDSERMRHSADDSSVFVTHYCSRTIPVSHRNDRLPETLHARIHAHAAQASAAVEAPF